MLPFKPDEAQTERLEGELYSDAPGRLGIPNCTGGRTATYHIAGYMSQFAHSAVNMANPEVASVKQGSVSD